MKISVSKTYIPFSKACMWKVAEGQERVSLGLTKNRFSFFGIASTISTLCVPFTLVWIRVFSWNQKVKFAFRGGRKSFDLLVSCWWQVGFPISIYLEYMSFLRKGYWYHQQYNKIKYFQYRTYTTITRSWILTIHKAKGHGT